MDGNPFSQNSLDDFAREFLGRVPRLFLQQHELEDIPTTGTLWELVQTGKISYPSLQVVKNGVYVSPSRFAVDINYGVADFTGILDSKRLAEEFKNGGTLVFNGVNRFYPVLSEICHIFSARWKCNVNANAYLTPSNSSGFDAHYDLHDVFVLQVDGRKHWKVFDPLVRNGRRRKNQEIPNDLGAPREVFLLEPGMVLYLPSGFIHSAACENYFSLHITFGVAHVTWYQLIRELIRYNRDRIELLERVAYESMDSCAIMKTLVKKMGCLCAEGEIEAVLDDFEKNGAFGEVFPSASLLTDLSIDASSK